MRDFLQKWTVEKDDDNMNAALRSMLLSLAGKRNLPKARSMLPPAQYKRCTIKNVEVPLPDGVRLKASISCPDFKQKWPVVLMRQPYVFYDWMRSFLHKLFAEQGYAFAMVHVRGLTDSEGEFQAFQEDADGRSVLDWLGEQTWCDGNIATFGGSYVGNMQWAIADYHHPMLKTMFIAMFGAESYEVFYHRGLFHSELWTEWTAQMCKKNRNTTLLGKAAAELREGAFSVRPASGLSEYLGGEPCGWYADWTSNWRPEDAYWNTGYWGKLREMPAKVNIPIALLGGWYDIFLDTMLSSYARLPQAVRDQSVFLIGPWHHGGTPGGDLNYPGEDIAGPIQVVAAIKWFNHVIKGKPFDYPIGGIYAYAIGENQWEGYTMTTPSSQNLCFWLDAKEKSNGAYGAETLLPEYERTKSYVYDPAKPVISRGGRLIANHNDAHGRPECSCLQEAVGKRDDVISFVSDPLLESVRISGRIQARLFVSSNTPATAFTVKISEMMADGKAYNIRDDYTDIRWAAPNDGFIDYTPGQVRELRFDMEDISWLVRAGSRLRIDVSSSSFPQFPSHLNTLQPWADAEEGVVAHQTIYTGGKYPSCITLPIPDKRP